MNETWWRSPEQLDPDQQNIISLPLEGSHLVTGPPGSGKTNLLLLRATFLTRAGFPNIALITYNRMLKEFLITGADNYPFEAERIQTFRSWAASLLKSSGVSVDTDCSYEKMMTNIKAGLDEISSQYHDDLVLDCILIDEVQDYSIDEIDLFRSFSKEIFAVGDNNQRIYKANGAIAHLSKFCNVAPALIFHYRNGLAICRLADGIMNVQDGGMVETCNYDETKYPSTVQRHGGLTVAQQVSRAVPELETQLLAYPDEWIGVLAPLKRDVSEVFKLLAQSSVGAAVQLQKYDSGYDALDPTRPIVVTTMHSAKGLEFRATHLFSVDNLPRLDHDQRLAYTAVTRAKTSLSLYHNGAIPGYLERGLVALNGAPIQPPRLSDLFGDNKK
jgi:superfamily I DNA/RNA helicase